MAVVPIRHKTVACVSHVVVLCPFNSHWLSSLGKYNVPSAFVAHFPIGLVPDTALANEYLGAFLIVSSLCIWAQSSSSLPVTFNPAHAGASRHLGKVDASAACFSGFSAEI